MRILISTYALCGPDTVSVAHPGSEYIIAWNYISELARQSGGDICVLAGSSDGTNYMGSFENLKKNQLPPNVSVVEVKPSFLTRALDFLFRRCTSLIWPLALRSWNRDAFLRAKALHDKRAFDIVHQYGPGGFKNPGFLHQLGGVRSFWGPVYGWHYYSLRQAWAQSLLVFARCAAWNVLNWLASLDPGLNRAARGYSGLIFGTPEASDRFFRYFGRTGPIIPEQGCEGSVEFYPSEFKKPRIMWVGSLDFRKNLSLFLRVLRRIDLSKIEVSIVGRGPQARYLKNRFEDVFDHPNVTYKAFVERQELLKTFADVDAIVFTTMAEGNTSVLFEALQAGVIPIAPNTHGFKNTVPSVGGFVVDMDSRSNAVENEFAALIAGLLDIDLAAKRRDVLRLSSKFMLSTLVNRHLKNYREG